MGYSPWDCKESDTAEQLTLQISPTGASSHTHTHTHKLVNMKDQVLSSLSCFLVSTWFSISTTYKKHVRQRYIYIVCRL